MATKITAAMVKQLHRRFDRGHGRFAHRGDLLVTARQIPQIKHPRLDRRFDVFFHVVVRI